MRCTLIMSGHLNSSIQARHCTQQKHGLRHMRQWMVLHFKDRKGGEKQSTKIGSGAILKINHLHACLAASTWHGCCMRECMAL
mmetsp:Transcript_34930/g.58466  ORF Transcript_34930/g.58466 Transcript_34930/m.58466 type:complete len:83 (-) Transcript_34930:1051-1299(-)